MLRLTHARAIIAASLLVAASAPAADQPTPDWLRGSGKDLQLCLQGEVLDSDGQPATDFQLQCEPDATIPVPPLNPSIDGHRFKIWILLNQTHWFSIRFKAASKVTGRVAYKVLQQYELRQAAIDGIKLTLETPSRHVFVSVTDNGRPVSGASINATLRSRIELRSTTDASGIARFNLLPQPELSFLSAWTDDYRIGGFSFNAPPPRDPDAVKQTIELSHCRDQKIRFVDENGLPVSGLEFIIQIATPPPHSNYFGNNEHSHLTTDVAGEAVYRWYPNWEKVQSDIEINEDVWFLNGDPKTIDGVEVLKLKKGKPRKQITGRVLPGATGAGGFFVTLYSIQGQRENRADTISTFSNPDGTFAADVLPDATYSAYVLDSRWVGKIIDLIPFNSENDKTTPVELEISDGQPVEVVVTSGPKNKPVPNLTINLFRERPFSWLENGKQRTSICRAEFWAITDESGTATARTLPGQLRVYVYEPRWRAGQVITVLPDQPAKITLHRDIGEKHTVKGHLILASDAAAPLHDSEIRIVSLDANYKDEQSLTCNQDGEFSFDTASALIGVSARTHDDKAAGATILNDLAAPIELALEPTLEYRGQLLFNDGQPAVGRHVYGMITFQGIGKNNLPITRSFEVTRAEATTDEQGNFTLSGLVSNLKTTLYAAPSDSSKPSTPLGDVLVQPNESPPRATYRLREAADSNPPAKHE